MNVLLFDDPRIKGSLLPLTYVRPVSYIRVGIFTIHEKWKRALNTTPGFVTDHSLSHLFPSGSGKDNLLINGALCPDIQIVAALKNLRPGSGLCHKGYLLGYRLPSEINDRLCFSNLMETCAEYSQEVTLISKPWHIFQKNAGQIKADFPLVVAGRKSAVVSDKYTVVYNQEAVFIEEGASIKSAVIDAEKGPVYIGKNTKIHPGTVIYGSFALLDHSEVAIGTKLRGDTTVGPFSKVGGEITNSVIFGYSNKGHEGYLGNSVIGEWCNLGAATNTSNMKNDYKNVRLWDYSTAKFEDTGSAFCGLIMGDHTKTGINVMFNSGTSVGIACNLYNPGYFRNLIPSFYMGSPDKLSTHPLKKSMETASRMMHRRNVSFSDSDAEVFQKVFELTAQFRKQ